MYYFTAQHKPTTLSIIDMVCFLGGNDKAYYCNDTHILKD
jgi:hypothetical protein